MTESEIKKKLDYAIQINSELPELELKTATKNIPNDIWRSISAFAHRRGGGTIVFGIRQNYDEAKIEVAGCEDIDGMQTKLVEIFNDKMSFILRPTYYVMKIGAKSIIAVYVPECPREYRPCYFRPVGLPFGAYIREGITNRPITDNEFRTYVASSKQFQFDLSEAQNAELSDLSHEKIKILLEKRENSLKRGARSLIDNELLKNIGAVGDFGGTLKPTIAGFLLFANTIPQDRYQYERYTIRCVRFSGNDASSSIIDKLDVRGTLDTQIDDSYKFILKNIKKEAHISGTKRMEKYEYPENAIRELIANATIHRDYKIIETYTQIYIFKDRIEITNPGCLPPGVTVDNLKNAQFSRNAVIAARMNDLDYLEEYGRGIDIVFNQMEKWELPQPIFRNSVNSFQAILLGDLYRSINLRQLRIIDHLLLKKKLNIKYVMKILKGVPRITISSDLKKLVDLEIIEKKGSSVSTYYELTI